MKEKKILTYIVNFSLALVLTVVGAVSFSADIGSEATASAPYYSAPGDDNSVSLMFNVYGGEEYLNGIVETLKSYGAKATFFIGGVWAIKHEDSLLMLKNSGNEIANHGYLHRDHKKMNYEQNKDEIKTAERTIEGICGIKTNLFAPPSGSFSDNTIKACDDLGYKVIMWSRDTIDWRDKNADIVHKRATEKTQAGDLILMHPTEHTLEALPRILETLKIKGFDFKTVGESIMIG